MAAETLRSDLVSRDPQVHSGDAVFTGTRVPVETLINLLQDGYSIDQYLSDYPSVRREQVIAALETLRKALLGPGMT